MTTPTRLRAPVLPVVQVKAASAHDIANRLHGKPFHLSDFSNASLRISFSGVLPELALKLSDAGVPFADSPVAGQAVIPCHGDTPSFKPQFVPTMEQIGRHAIAAGPGRHAFAGIKVSSALCSFSAADQRRRRPWQRRWP